MLIISILSVLFILLAWISVQDSYALYFGHDISIASHLQNSLLLPKQISSTEKGDVYVVWVDKNNIYLSSSHNNGVNFSQQVLLSNNKTSSSSLSPSFPQIAATEKGDVYVVWEDKDNKTGDSNIEFIGSNDSGKTFSPKKELRGGRTLSLSPQLSVTENGKVYVVWEDKDNKTGDSNIEFIGSNDSGKTFSPNTKLRGGNTLTFTPQIAATEKGDVHVAWVDKSSKTGDTDIHIRSSFDDGRTFDDRKRLRSNDLLSFSPQMAATERGEVYVVWIDRNSTTAESQISFRASHDGGKTFDRVINLDKDRKNFLNSSSPQLAAAGNSTVYVAWVDHQIQFKEILVNDGIVGNLVSLSNRTSSSLSPQVTVADNGNAYVFWIDKSSPNDSSIHFKKISEYSFDRHS